MGIKSARRNVSEAERKLLLLLLVQALEPISAEPLWQFASEYALLDDYFGFRLALHELTESGQLAAGTSALENQLYLTDQGREALRLFGNRLPGSAREAVSAHAEAFKAAQRCRRQVRAVYESAERGAYTVAMRLTEGDVSTLRVRVRTKRRAVARDCQQRFDRAAAELLRLLYLQLPTLALNATEDGATSRSDAPAGRFAVEAASATEFLAHAQLPPTDGAEIEFWLLFPSAESAQEFVAEAGARAVALATCMLRLLRGGKSA